MSLHQTRPFRASLVTAAAALVLAACGSTASEVTSAVEPATNDAAVAASTAADSTEEQTPSSAEDDGGEDTETAAAAPSGPRAAIPVLSSDEAIANAEANIGDLQLTDDALDIEVLAVGDGSVTTLREVADGDRAVLLWFYAPH